MLISPVLAGLAVGIGVPILLFYVYGVVPVSLCRSGGCGVTTTGTGVKFEFDDETDLISQVGARNPGILFLLIIHIHTYIFRIHFFKENYTVCSKMTEDFVIAFLKSLLSKLTSKHNA